MKHFYIPFLMILFLRSVESFAQDIPVKPDSMDLKNRNRRWVAKTGRSLRSGQLPLRLPTESGRKSSAAIYSLPTVHPGAINIRIKKLTSPRFTGRRPHLISSIARVARPLLQQCQLPTCLLHSSATIGMVETPFLVKANYYILDAGLAMRSNPALTMGVSGGYNSNFDVMPLWNAGIDASYQVNRKPDVRWRVDLYEDG
jgi:hypothetical protein